MRIGAIEAYSFRYARHLASTAESNVSTEEDESKGPRYNGGPSCKAMQLSAGAVAQAAFRAPLLGLHWPTSSILNWRHSVWRENAFTPLHERLRRRGDHPFDTCALLNDDSLFLLRSSWCAASMPTHLRRRR
ncbi:hypothetical protein D918_01357 [Trichuris suis]|nr:hypothetical protein D918_01357 [Trichuris suis]